MPGDYKIDVEYSEGDPTVIELNKDGSLVSVSGSKLRDSANFLRTMVSAAAFLRDNGGSKIEISEQE